MKKVFIVLLLLCSLPVFCGPALIVSENVSLQLVAENVWVHTSFIEIEPWGMIGANGLAVYTDGTLVLIDTPWNNGQTETLVSWFKEKHEIVDVKVIASHHHNDNLGGLGWIHEQGFESFAGRRTISLCKKLKLPVPANTISDDKLLNFGSLSVRMYFPGEGHTVDAMCAYLPEQKILFGGCSVKALSNLRLGNIADANVSAWPGSLAKMKLTFANAELVIPGHGKSGGLELIDHTLSLFK